MTGQGKLFQGETDGEGLTKCLVASGKQIEAYFSGRKAAFIIDETKENYSLAMPFLLTDLEDDIPRLPGGQIKNMALLEQT